VCNLFIMLNFPTENRDDIDLLQSSFDLLGKAHSVEVVDDHLEMDRVFKIIANSITLPTGCAISIANLFRIIAADRSVFIAQCLQDFRFSVRGRQPINDSYYYITLGLAELAADFGRIIVRPEGVADRLVGKFIRTDIEVPNSDQFNRKYYVAATDSAKARAFLSISAVKYLATTKGAHLQVNRGNVILRFENEMTKGQAVMMGNILLSVGVH
jgi:hypothetical protein